MREKKLIHSNQLTSEQPSVKKITPHSMINAIKHLTAFASEQYREIENYYRYNDQGYVFYEPMNVPANSPGGINRGNEVLQINAFVLARNVYFNLISLLPNKNLSATLRSIKLELDKLQLVKNSDVRAHQLGTTNAYPLEDRFYSAYQKFSQNIEEILTYLDTIQIGPSDYEKDIRLTLTQQARYLIIEGGMTPEDFQSALQAYEEEMQGKDKDDAINFDYYYQINSLFSIYEASIEVKITNGKIKFISEIIPKDLLITQLKDYLNTLKQKHVELFFEVFGEIYFQEILYPNAQRTLQSDANTRNEPQRWTMFNFWSQEQKNHYLKMSEVRKDIQQLNASDEVCSLNP